MASKDVVNISTSVSAKDGFISINEEFKRNDLLIEQLKEELENKIKKLSEAIVKANDGSSIRTYVQETDPAPGAVKYAWWETSGGNLVTLWINVV